MLPYIEPGFPIDEEQEYEIVEVMVEYFDRPQEKQACEPECIEE